MTGFRDLIQAMREPAPARASDALTEGWVAALNDRDVDLICSLVDPEVVVHPVEGRLGAVPGAVYHGRRGVRSLVSAAFAEEAELKAVAGERSLLGPYTLVPVTFMTTEATGEAAPPVGVAFATSDRHITRVRAFDSVPLARAVLLDEVSSLTRREREILELLARGYSPGEVAELLVISVFTVRSHLWNARHRLGARSLTHAVTLALCSGQIQVGEHGMMPF